jgi:hypothetical protein
MGNGKIKITNKDLLIKIFKIVSWLDKKRWCNENQQKEREKIFATFDPNLTNSEKILTHWLCYITDRQMPSMRVWKNGGAVFSNLVQKYKTSGKYLKEILREFVEEKEEKEKKKIVFKTEIDGDVVEYTSRFITVDYQHILQTLEVLNSKKYTRDIVAFILHFVERFKDKRAEECLKRVACALYLLTYRLNKDKENFKKFKASSEEVFKILENQDNKFEEEFKNFKNRVTEGKKRLWASLRDYKKGFISEIFKEAIKEVAKDKADYFIKIWEDLPMEELELPGDRWNNDRRFKEWVLGKAMDMKTVPKSWDISTLIREIYKKHKDELEEINFYPEQFDITFDFVRKMCEENLCNICLFGEKGIELICVPNEKYCTVALVTCGYLAPCDGESCIIRKENLGRGICNVKVKE